MDIEAPEIRVEGANFAVTLEYIGEGQDGDYNPSDPNDTPLYRFSTERRIADAPADSDEAWEDVDSGSYCTQIPATCSPDVAQRAAEHLLAQIEAGAEGSVKRVCERLSWTKIDDLPVAA